MGDLNMKANSANEKIVNSSNAPSASVIQPSRRQTNNKVLVHCFAGISRSATIVLAYLMVHERMHLHLAIKLLREKHAISKPNQGFMNQLLRFYHKLK